MERQIKCKICGKDIIARSTLKRYCEECAKEMKKQHFKRWVKHNREYYIEYLKNYQKKYRSI